MTWRNLTGTAVGGKGRKGIFKNIVSERGGRSREEACRKGRGRRKEKKVLEEKGGGGMI